MEAIEGYGLQWVETTFTLEPRWSVEPQLDSIEAIARNHLGIPTDVRCLVKFYKQGGFNKLYTIMIDQKVTHLMRVSLPVDPGLKTKSEVSTMEYVHQNTQILLPTITAFDSSNQNILKFEWSLMDFGPPDTLASTWRFKTMLEKQQIVETLAGYHAELYKHKFQTIGSLYKSSNTLNQQQSDYTVGTMVAMTFFWGDRDRKQVARGPFQNSYAWLDARLRVVIGVQEGILETADDEDVIEDAMTAKSLATQLHNMLTAWFDPEERSESSILCHDDLGLQNILVAPPATPWMIDWECVQVLPLWRACQFPRFLLRRTRTVEPVASNYGSEQPDPTDNDNLYWEHLSEYECWQLRSTFLARMQEIEPEWIDEYHKGAARRDFELAVQSCDNEFAFRPIQQWLDARKKDVSISLFDIFFK